MNINKERFDQVSEIANSNYVDCRLQIDQFFLEKVLVYKGQLLQLREELDLVEDVKIRDELIHKTHTRLTQANNLIQALIEFKE